MSPSFNSARLSVEVGGLDLSVLALSGQEGLSQPFCYHLDILCAPAISCAQLLDLPARISVTGSDGGCRTICGVVTSVEEKDPHHDGRRCLSLTVESSLGRLRLQHDTRLFLHQSIPQILRVALEGHGIVDDRLRLRLSRHYPVRPWTLQVNESDFDFIARLLARAGIFYWSEADADGELLCFSDHNAHLCGRPGAALWYRPGAGMEPQSCGIRALQVRRRMVADLFEAQEKSRREPSRSLHAQASNGGAGRLRRYRYAAGVEDLNEAEQIARTEAQQAQASSFELQAQTDLADLCVGQIVSLDTGGLPSQYSGEYLIRALSLRLSQSAGTQAAGDDLALRCEATLIPRETPFRPPWAEHPRIPFTFSARIEGSETHAPLDEHGRTPVRAHFDRSAAAHSEASIPLPRLTPHGGPPANQACGLHTPLHDGAEVLLSCLNGDPDRPVLVGTLPNPATPGPVTVANPAQNILRTAADNQLLMDDRREQEVIRLSTFAGNNILELNATALGHRIALASHQGALQIQAQKTQHIQCGDTLTEQSGNDRSHSVENRHATQTRSAEIHHQAATDHHHRAAANLRLESDRNTEMTSAQSLRLDVAQGQKLTVRGPEATFSVLNGAVHIQAAREIDIQGQGGGDISFSQNGGGFIVTAAGNVGIFGKTVTLGGQGGASLNGPTSYQIGGAQAMPAMEKGQILKARGIAPLRDQKDPAIVNPAWARTSVPVGEVVDLLFTVKNFQGGEAVQIRIYELEADGSYRQIDTLQCRLDDGFGHYRLHWRRSAEQAQDDLLHDANALDPRPLTYFFDVAVGDICSEYSPGLHLTTTLRFTPTDWEGRSLPEGTEYQLVDALGRRQAERIRQGELRFDAVAVGPWQLLGASETNLFEAQE